jgi:hypothetical protein
MRHFKKELLALPLGVVLLLHGAPAVAGYYVVLKFQHVESGLCVGHGSYQGQTIGGLVDCDDAPEFYYNQNLQLEVFDQYLCLDSKASSSRAHHIMLKRCRKDINHVDFEYQQWKFVKERGLFNVHKIKAMAYNRYIDDLRGGTFDELELEPNNPGCDCQQFRVQSRFIYTP